MGRVYPGEYWSRLAPGMRLTRAVALTALLSLVAVPSAGAQLPVGEADGVRIFKKRGAIVVKFTPRAGQLWRRVADRRVLISCVDLPADPRDRNPTFSSEAGFRAPKRGRTLRVRIGRRTPGIDYCMVFLDRRMRPRIASLALTELGALYLDEAEKANALAGVLYIAGRAAEGAGLEGCPTHSQLLTFWADQSGAPPLERLARAIIPLAGPDETPPNGEIGYYGDAGRAAAVVVSGLGRRLFIQLEPDEVQRTNVSDFIGPLGGFLEFCDPSN